MLHWPSSRAEVCSFTLKGKTWSALPCCKHKFEPKTFLASQLTSCEKKCTATVYLSYQNDCVLFLNRQPKLFYAAYFDIDRLTLKIFIFCIMLCVGYSSVIPYKYLKRKQRVHFYQNLLKSRIMMISRASHGKT